jgi:hypothetical protein
VSKVRCRGLAMKPRHQLALLLCCCAHFAAAQAATDSPRERPASSLAAAYFYLPDIQGHAALGPAEVRLDLKRNALLGGARAGFMGYARHDKDTHFAYVEGIYLRFSEAPFPAFFSQAVDSRLSFLEAGVGQIIALPLKHTEARFYTGLRYLDISIGIEGPQIFQAAAERGIDVTVGASLEGAIGGAWNYGLKVDAAGFDLTRRSYRSATALLIYDVGTRTKLIGGWRAARFQSRPGAPGLALDVSGQGPQIGWVYQFR